MINCSEKKASRKDAKAQRNIIFTFKCTKYRLKLTEMIRSF